MSKVTAFVLDAEDVLTSGAKHFPGFPGVWTPGVAIEAEEFVKRGLFGTVKEMETAVKDLGLPLKRTSVEAGTAPIPPRPNHIEPAAEEPVEPEPVAEPAGEGSEA